MVYINGGVTRHGAPIATKTALRGLVMGNAKKGIGASPDSVRFFSTARLGTQFEGSVSKLPPGSTLSVCGPDPYTDRRWYASITRTPSGSLKVT